MLRVRVQAAASGTATLTSTVDPQNRAPETFEFNNTQTLTVTVQ